MTMVMAQVLYDSAFYKYRSSLNYSGAETSGFEAINAVDWRDWTIFQSAAGTTHLKVQLTAAMAVDALVVWSVVAGSAATLSWSADGSSWTTLGTITTASASPEWLDFASVTVPLNGWLRITFAASAQWRLLSAGAKLQFPIGQWSGLNPLSIYQGVVVENVISTNGSILGSNIKRTAKTATLSMPHLTPEWVRASWDPFTRHAAKRAFWYRWDPSGHPTEVAFAAASGIEAPLNDKPGRMKVELPVYAITD